MAYSIASILGYLSVGFYLLAVFNYVIKALNKKYSEKIRQSDKLRQFFIWGMKHIVKNHKIFGFLTFTFFLAHSLIQYVLLGFNLTGMVAAGFLLAQVGLGFYGFRGKRKFKAWLPIHRGVGGFLLIFIIMHSLFT